MTAEDRDAHLTAFALGDPGLPPAARTEIEARLATDSEARRAVDETRHLAQLLTAGLAAEQAALPADKPVTIPAVPSATRRSRDWVRFVVAAAVLLAVGGGSLAVWNKWKADRDDRLALSAGGRAELSELETSIEKYTEKRTPRTINRRDDYGDVESMKSGTPGRGGIASPDEEKKADKDSAAAIPADPRAPAPTVITPATATTPAPEPGLGGPGIGSGGVPPPGLPGGPAGPGFGGASATKGPGGPVPGSSPPTAQTPAGVGRPALNPEAAPMPGKSAPRPGYERPQQEQAKPGEGYPARPTTGESKPEPRRDGPGGKGDPNTGDSQKQDELSKKGKEGKDEKGLTDLPHQPDDSGRPGTNDKYPRLLENGFVRVEGMNALSTFGVDVDTASYAIVRKYLSMNQLPPANAVRLEELVNYFPYQDKAPTGDDPYAVTVEMAECPWQPGHRLVRLGLKAKPIDLEKRPVSNLVFLIDVSGSMNEPNKLPLVKASLKLLVNQLGENDRVAMVVYAGASGLVLDSTSAMKREKILEAIDNLSAGGSTNGEGGIQQAYSVAAANFIKGGTNRIILCTDGDWNVGTTSTEGLVQLIEKKRETGVFLSVFGFGMGNLRDEMMVKLAGKGNGNYGYIDNLKEANKALVEQISGTLVTVAKDVKVQVEFNPAVIQSYRLLGYEKRHLEAQDFHDDKKDAGEMGAGHVVTALYELIPVGVAAPGKVDGLRYQQDPAPKVAAKGGEKATEAFVVKMRHKKPDGDKSTLRELPVSDVTMGYEKASEDFRFSAAVASFAMLLRDSSYKGSSNYALLLELAQAAMKHDPSGYRAEFLEMVKKAKALSGKP